VRKQSSNVLILASPDAPTPNAQQPSHHHHQYLQRDQIDTLRTEVMAEYSSLKVPELKKLLAEKGLPQTGNKADLIARLTEDDSKNVAPETTIDAEVPATATASAETAPETATEAKKSGKPTSCTISLHCALLIGRHLHSLHVDYAYTIHELNR
jgi:hypothetical protein